MKHFENNCRIHSKKHLTELFFKKLQVAGCHRCFPVNYPIFIRVPIFQSTIRNKKKNYYETEFIEFTLYDQLLSLILKLLSGYMGIKTSVLMS